MNRNRKGLSLIEILVAVAVIGGPLVYCLSGVVSTTRNTGKQLDRATAQLMLTDMAEWIMAKGHVRPRMLARFAKEELKERWMPASDFLEPERAAQFEKQVDLLLSKMKTRFEPAAGGHKGLARVIISSELSDKTPLSVSVLIRGVPHWHKWKKKGDRPNA